MKFYRHTHETACAQATARGTATALRDSLPALFAAQVTIKGVATVRSAHYLGKWHIGKLTIVTSFGQNECSEASGMIGGRYPEVDGESKDLAQPADLGRPTTIADVV